MTDTAASPAISVILNSYNRTQYLKEAIESIQQQTCSDWELLIVDDASENPKSRQIARQYAEQDRRIRTLFLRRNVGLVGARNAGIGAVKSRYICFQDDDDISHPRRLETQLALLTEKPEFAAVAGRLILCNAQLKVKGIWGPGSFASARPATGWPAFNVGGPASMIRRDALLETGGYRRWFKMVEDWDMTFRLQDRYPIASIPDAAMLYRNHDERRMTHDLMVWHYHNAAFISAHCRRTGRKDPIEDSPDPKVLTFLLKDMPEAVRNERLIYGVETVIPAINTGKHYKAQLICSGLFHCYEDERILARAAPLDWTDAGAATITAKVLSRLPQTAAVREFRQWHSLLTDLWNAISWKERGHFSALMKELRAPRHRQQLTTVPPSVLLQLTGLLVRHRIGIPKQLRQILLSQAKQDPSRMKPALGDSLFCAGDLKALMTLGHYRDIRFLLKIYAIGAAQGGYRSHLRRMKGKALKYSLLHFRLGYWLAR